MKTVLQELIEKLEDSQKGSSVIVKSTLQIVIELARHKLEKEKQQTINFAHKCRLINDIDLDGNVSFVFTPELQFNQMYDEQ